MFVNEVVEPQDKKKKLSFELFLNRLKNIENISIDKEKTKQGNTKIRYNQKIIWYCHAGKKYPVLFWDNQMGKQRHIKSLKELDKVVSEIQ